jgi:hypothetical protein
LSKIIETIQLLLNTAYSNIPGDDASKKSPIEKSMRDFSTELNNASKGKIINYDDPIRVFSYLYRYFPFRLYLLSEHIKSCPVLLHKLKSQELNISSLGGGPCTDVFSVISSINKEFSIKHNYKIFDLSEIWLSSIKLVSESLGLKIEYSKFDAFDRKLNFTDTFSNTDVYSLSYFISEIFFRSKLENSGNEFREFFMKLISSAKSSSIFICFDLFNKEIKQEIDSVIENSDVTLLISDDGDCSSQNARKLFPDFEKKFFDDNSYPWTPQASGNTMWRIFQKN